MKYYRNLYNHPYMIQLLLNNGIIIICYTEEDVLKCCTDGNSISSIVVNGNTFRKDTIKSVYFGNGWNLNNIPNYFCFNFTNLIYLDPLPNIITSIGNYFMCNCSLFNQPITIPDSVTSIGDHFMNNCNSFNQLLILPSNIEIINNNFLTNSKSFNQPLTLPDSITSIGVYFLRFCESFNSSLKLSNNIKSIGNSFMQYCSMFSQPLTLPASIEFIGSGWIMTGCDNFTGPLNILFTNPDIFAKSPSILSTSNNASSMYTTGVTITGNMTGAQLRTRLPNGSLSIGISPTHYRKILG